MNLRHTFVSGIGVHIPDRILNNHDLEKMVDTSDEWIRTRTGIIERRIAPSDCATSDMAVIAARMAIKEAGLTPEKIDLIICATITPDMLFPSTSCLVQKELGCINAVAFDISAACSGFIYALYLADLFIKTGTHDHVLIIGAETLSKFTDWEDRATCVLFGDGAGAVILSPSEREESRIISVHIFSDGRYSDFLQLPGGGSRFPTSYESIDKRLHYIKMKGNETFKLAVKCLVSASMIALEENKLPVEKLDMLICHQANIRIIKAVAQRLGLPDEKVVITLDKFGNTSAASIPISLWDVVRQGKLAKGNYILLTAFGGGLTWGSALLKW